LTANPLLGIALHALGGLAAGSFYIPFKGVRNWKWETYWLVNGFVSWIVVPWVVVALTVPDAISVLRESPIDALLRCYVFGVLWGVGGLTFGLSVRYLGMSLGYALALGFCAAFGTIIPPMLANELAPMLRDTSGVVTLSGVVVCLLGIAVCGRAGVWKERELSAEQKKTAVGEFSFIKGVLVAVFAGVMSAFMAFAIAAGEPIAELAVKNDTPPLFQNSPVFVVIFLGGFTTNFVWCVCLHVRNRSAKDYLSAAGASLPVNYILSALAGATWYCQFLFYGMGTTQMGEYDFSSWTIHMAFIIVFSNLWGLWFREWKGSSRRTIGLIVIGILVLVGSTIVVGFGNYLAPSGAGA